MITTVVTGGAGFIGSHLVRGLLSHGAAVRVLDNFATGHRHNLAALESVAGFELVEGDVRDEAVTRRVCDGAAVVFHLAALGSVPRSIADPVTSHDVNVTGTVRVLEAARHARVKRVVYASSSSVYGGASGAGATSEKQPFNPKSPYAASKVAAEMYARAYASAYSLHTVVLRFFNVFGERQDADSPYAAAIPRFVRAMREGRAPVVFGDGEQTRDFTYIDNVVHLCLRAAEAECAPGSVYNGGCGTGVTVNHMVKVLRVLTGYDGPVRYDPPRVGDVLHSHADIAAARADLGYDPAIAFEAGLARFVGNADPAVRPATTNRSRSGT